MVLLVCITIIIKEDQHDGRGVYFINVMTFSELKVKIQGPETQDQTDQIPENAELSNDQYQSHLSISHCPL